MIEIDTDIWIDPQEIAMVKLDQQKGTTQLMVQGVMFNAPKIKFRDVLEQLGEKHRHENWLAS